MEYASCRHNENSPSLHKLQGDSYHVNKQRNFGMDKSKKVTRAIAAVSPIMRTETAEPRKAQRNGIIVFCFT